MKTTKHAEIGDIVVLENGLKMRIVEDLEQDYTAFKTIDLETNANCTIGYELYELKDFIIGKKAWGFGVEKHKIVEITGDTEYKETFVKQSEKELEKYSTKELLEELLRRQ